MTGRQEYEIIGYIFQNLKEIGRIKRKGQDFCWEASINIPFKMTKTRKPRYSGFESIEMTQENFFGYLEKHTNYSPKDIKIKFFFDGGVRSLENEVRLETLENLLLKSVKCVEDLKRSVSNM